MIIRPILSLTLTMFLSLPGHLAAQSENKDFRLKFTCLYWEGSPPEKLYYREGKAFHPLEFREGARSDPFTLKAMKTFEVYRDVKAPKEGQPPYQPVCSAKIPAGCKQALFLVLPIKFDREMRYKVFAMDDSVTSFPAGTFRFVNFTSQPFSVKLAEDVQTIPSGGVLGMSFKAGPNGGFRPFAINDAKGKPVYGTRLFGQPSGRELVFISPPAEPEGMPRVKYVSQLVAPDQPAPTPDG